MEFTSLAMVNAMFCCMTRFYHTFSAILVFLSTTGAILCFSLMPFTFQVSDEAKYMKTSKMDRTQQIQELHSRIDENSLAESSSKKTFEDDIQSSLNSVLASYDSSRAEFHLTCEEKQQNVAVSITLFYIFIYLLTLLFDHKRGEI